MQYRALLFRFYRVQNCISLVNFAGSAVLCQSMKKLFICIIALMAAAGTLLTYAANPAKKDVTVLNATASADNMQSLYDRLGLTGTVGFKAFSRAMAGRDKISRIRKKNLLVIIDFTKPSTAERMCVVDLMQEKVLFSSHVAHGRNSGGNYATSFSNRPGSYQSSLGFYLTENTYNGRNGYSLVLDGLEKGINDKAKERAIVIHGASYCNPSFIPSAGRLGRSHGCPALPTIVSRDIIDTIKGGALIYIHAEDNDYFAKSILP